jgi:hypothetical protein
MPDRQPYAAAALGVTVMPEWFQHEGIEPVLDRIESIGARAIATSPYVLERVAQGDGGREPPADGEAGKVRPLDRPLFGATELWVRTSPAFRHDLSRYEGLRYAPAPPTPLTDRWDRLLDHVCDAASRRGIEVYLQVMAASPPGYRVQFSTALTGDQCLGPDGREHGARVDRNASLASDHVGVYVATLLAELAGRYPSVTGFRLDWPEYPPYDLASALFDFNDAALTLMRDAGHDPAQVAAAARDWQRHACAAAVDAAPHGQDAVHAALHPCWRSLLDPGDALSALFDAKRTAVRRLLARCRRALDDVSGPRRRLEPQVFPPPFGRLSGLALDDLSGVADAVGVKLYTMHWPMIARYWARDLVGSSQGPAADAVSVAVARLFGLVDAAPPDARAFRYPDPTQDHPAGTDAQRAKIATARTAAGAVPVIAFAHSYGPRDDVLRRLALCRSASAHAWINRYGYLSDAKLAALATAAQPTAA